MIRVNKKNPERITYGGQEIAEVWTEGEMVWPESTDFFTWANHWSSGWPQNEAEWLAAINARKDVWTKLPYIDRQNANGWWKAGGAYPLIESKILNNGDGSFTMKATSGGGQIGDGVGLSWIMLANRVRSAPFALQAGTYKMHTFSGGPEDNMEWYSIGGGFMGYKVMSLCRASDGKIMDNGSSFSISVDDAGKNFYFETSVAWYSRSGFISEGASWTCTVGVWLEGQPYLVERGKPLKRPDEVNGMLRFPDGLWPGEGDDAGFPLLTVDAGEWESVAYGQWMDLKTLDFVEPNTRQRTDVTTHRSFSQSSTNIGYYSFRSSAGGYVYAFKKDALYVTVPGQKKSIKVQYVVR